MRLILDTQAALWFLTASYRISAVAREAIAERPAHDVIISAASVWEVAIKRANGKLLTDDLLDMAVAQGFSLLSMSPEHGRAAGALPMHHGDPFDRMLVAQAQIEGLPLVTNDPAIRRYAVTTIW